MKLITKTEFLSRVKVVNYKQSRGHDAPSYEWDIKFDNKKVCNCWDDSYGGELNVTNYDNHSIEEIYKTIEPKSLWDEEYQWTTSLELLMSDCATIHINQLEEKKGVLVGTKSKYMIHGYNKSIPFLIKRGNAY